jgi:hypothetical protein
VSEARFKLLRDLCLFLAGIAGIAHETILATEPRETLLLLFGAMAGLPAFIRKDEQRNGAH